jgi:hypothetical protein
VPSQVEPGGNRNAGWEFDSSGLVFGLSETWPLTKSDPDTSECLRLLCGASVYYDAAGEDRPDSASGPEWNSVMIRL